MARLDFVPGRDGFHFPNRFANHIGPFTSHGRCGGMTYAVLDHHLHGLAVPTHVAGDFGGAPVPPDGSALAGYILRRQVASLANLNAAKFLTWQGFWTSARARVEATLHRELPGLRARIDRGELTPLGLISPGGVTDSHQVLAYGYDHEPGGADVVYVYDSNRPDVECALRPAAALDAIEEFDLVTDPAMAAPVDTWRGWFVHGDYDFAHPQRPTYRDLELAEAPALDGPTLRFAVRNAGEFTAHVRSFGAALPGADRLRAGSATGELVDPGPALGVDLAVGSLHRARVRLASLGAGVGDAVAAMHTAQGHWVPVPPAG